MECKRKKEKKVPIDAVPDLISLTAKHYIFRWRCLNVRPNLIRVSKKVKQRAAKE